MALRLASSPLIRTSPSLQLAAALRSSSSLNGRVYFHATRATATTAGQTSSSVTDVYKQQAYKIPAPDQLHGSYHWDFERLLCVSMVPLFAASAINGAHPITDGLLGVVVPVHCHIGFDAMITDYFDPTKVGKLANKSLVWGLRGVSVLVLVGCYQFNTNDIGLTEFIMKSWQA
ncbi:membrane anchor subunit of succinate dehydrogenase, Sdh4 [Podila humilis]|nr:membrane anchor subunit of succinate dehydrogenase, Sdh4 [Podila humilis]